MNRILKPLSFLAGVALVALAAGGRARRSRGARRPGARRRRAGIDQAVLNAYKWRSIGPARGGRSIAVSGVKGRHDEAYFGAVGGGLWKTTDGGQNWDASHRRPDEQQFGRRRRRLRVEPRHRLHRDGRVVHPRQHPAGRRRLQVDRRRQDVDAHRLLRFRRHLEDPHPSDQSRHRLRRRLRPLRQAERRARAVQDAPTAARPGRRCSSATTRPARSTSSSIGIIPT